MATVYLAEDLQAPPARSPSRCSAPSSPPRSAPSASSAKSRSPPGCSTPTSCRCTTRARPTGFLYYVMPFVEGESLARAARARGRAPGRTTRCGSSARSPTRSPTRTRSGVVHRDIKPDNVLLSGRHALVTDFGVAKAVSEATGRQRSPRPAWRSARRPTWRPSRRRPIPASTTAPTSTRLACMALRAAGRPAAVHRVAPRRRSLAAHITSSRRRLTRSRPRCPPALAALVMRCLEKTSGRPLPQSADAVPRRSGRALDCARAVTPSAPVPAAIEPFRTGLPRSRRLYWPSA